MITSRCTHILSPVARMNRVISHKPRIRIRQCMIRRISRFSTLHTYIESCRMYELSHVAYTENKEAAMHYQNSRITHMNELRDTYKWSHVAHRSWVMSHTELKSCRTYELSHVAHTDNKEAAMHYQNNLALLDAEQVLQRVAACCSLLQCIAVCCSVPRYDAVCGSVLQCVAVCCSVLQCVAVCQISRAPRCWAGIAVGSVLQCVAVCCSVLQCVAVCCSVL